MQVSAWNLSSSSRNRSRRATVAVRTVPRAKQFQKIREPRRRQTIRSHPTPSASAAPNSSVVGKSSRLLSVDLLRGITIAFMILVNNNGDEQHAYWPLKHAAWNGFTPTDLVFPTFLLLVGVSLVFATESRLARGVTRMAIFWSALRRAVTLYLLGLVVNGFPFFHLATMRYYGVLHRIAICYLVATVLLLLSSGWRSKVVVIVGALVGYWALMRFVPVPGYGIPTHTVPLLDPDGNLAAFIDRHIFSARHLYEGTRDPEGLLSTLPAIATILIGVLTGLWIRTTRPLIAKIRGIALAGISLVLCGVLWNPWFPIHKKLWTSSYVLLAGGLSLLLLSLAMALVDVHRDDKRDTDRDRHPRLWFPFFVFGTNSIAAYVFSELLAGGLANIRVPPRSNVMRALFQAIHGVVPNLPLASLVFSLLFVVVCWLPIYLLYRKRIFLKV